MRESTATEDHDPLVRYLPRRAAEWDLDAPGQLWQRVHGALCFVDISGFTQLTERLSHRGRIGAEELTAVLDEVFGSMLRIAYDRGGSLVRFAGDALLLMFDSDDSAVQATSAAVEMRSSLRDSSQITTSVGHIGLRMSVGVHSGPIDLYLVGSSHRELVIVGETATKTFELEAAAGAGEILISDDLAALLPGDAAGSRKGPGRLLRWRKARNPSCGPRLRRSVPSDTVAAGIAPSLHGYLGEDRGDSEHRIATVGFVKYVGVGEALEAGGQDEVALRLNEFMGIVQDAADREGVTFLNADSDTDGGKVTLIAGVPATQEDDEGRMLRAARCILEANPTFPIQIGVSRGHLFTAHIGTEFRSAFTVMGDTINLAARLAGAAAPQSIIVSPEVVDRSRTLFDTAELEPLSVKGKQEPVTVCFVGPERGQRAFTEAGVLPFAGRVAELRVLEAAAESVAAGKGSVITITGDAGLGKTRLLREAFSPSSAPSELVVRADPTGVDNPYWAFRDPLRRLVGIERRAQEQMARDLRTVVERSAPGVAWALPLLADALHISIPDTAQTSKIEPRFRRPRTEGAVVDLIAEIEHGPLVIIAEDHHWMDEASRALVNRLARESRDRTWMLVATSRVGFDQTLSRIDAELTLEPLSPDEARRMVVAATEAAPLRPHDLESVLARGAGNPFFLGEIVRTARETGTVGELPEALDLLVRTRIDRLGEVPRQVLYHAAVLGRSFRRVVLDALLEADGLSLAGTIGVALDGYLEGEGDTRLRFRDAVVRDVAYEGLSYRRRRALHARAAMAIEGLAGVDQAAVAEPLAMHFSLAGDADGAWRYGLIAGDKARDGYSNVEAATQYRRALDAAGRLDQVDDDELRAVWAALADVLEQAGMFEDARGALRSALRLAAEDPVARADLLLRRARTWTMSGSYASAKRNITLGQRIVDRNGSSDARRAAARLDSYEAGIALNQGRPQVALEAAQRAVETAVGAQDDDALARSYVVLDWAYHMLGQGELATHGDQALEILERLGQLKRAGDVMNNQGGFAYFAGQWDEAVRWYRRSQDASQRGGNTVDAAYVRANIAEVFIGQRRFDEAAIELEYAHRVLRAADAKAYLPFVEVQMGRLDAVTGSVEKAISRLDRLETSLSDGGDQVASLEVAIHLADALLLSGDTTRAFVVLEHAEDLAGDEGTLFAAGIARVRSRALWAVGDREGARLVSSEGVIAAVDAGLPYEEALLRDWRILMALDSRSNPESEDLARRDELHEGLGIRPMVSSTKTSGLSPP